MAHAIETAQDRRISAANWMETAVVIDASRDPVASRRFDELVQIAELQVEPVTPDQARIARDAYRDFGKGSPDRPPSAGECRGTFLRLAPLQSVLIVAAAVTRRPFGKIQSISPNGGVAFPPTPAIAVRRPS